MKFNFVFLRHGQGCHNIRVDEILKPNELSKYKIDYEKNKHKYADPELSEVGVTVSEYNSCVVTKTIRALERTYKIGLDKIHIVGCSPLIRSMETAYFMTRKWKTPPSKIYVLPYLREVDESSDDKYSKSALENIENQPSYMMKSIEDQKRYLKQKGIYQFFDFSFVEKDMQARKDPGDIERFMAWFTLTFAPKMSTNVSPLNCYIITHAGVLRDYFDYGFYNNTGSVANVEIDPKTGQVMELKKFNLTDYISKKDLYMDYMINKFENYCPSDRCNNICMIRPSKSNRTNVNLQGSCETDGLA